MTYLVAAVISTADIITDCTLRGLGETVSALAKLDDAEEWNLLRLAAMSGHRGLGWYNFSCDGDYFIHRQVRYSQPGPRLSWF
jgi:hypothetical protein